MDKACIHAFKRSPKECYPEEVLMVDGANNYDPERTVESQIAG